MAPPAYRQHTNLLRAAESFSIEDGALVRRMESGRETRWPLAELRQAILVGHRIGGHASRLMLQLSFRGHRGVVLTSHSVRGLGRFDDNSAAFKAFGRAFLEQAPQARLGRAGAVAGSTLWWAIGALGCGALVVAASALASGATALGLDLGARLVFVLLLVSTILPWLGRDAGARLDGESLFGE